MKHYLEQLNNNKLRAYEADPGLLKEHAGIEETVLAGGYGYRQVLELVQNGADALLEERQQNGTQASDGRIHVQLRGRRLYVANTGAPLSEEGVDALLRSHSSPKRGNQIGRFGLGFKSLLKLNGRIDVFTRRSGAMRLDPERCRIELRERFKVTAAPSLRLAWALGEEERTADPTCDELAWAETIVRVEIASDDLLNHLMHEIQAFPAEFLLFFPIPTQLTLVVGEQDRHEIRISVEGSDHVLHDGKNISRWRIAQREVQIDDQRALADATHVHARDSVPIAWAIPLEGRREEAGRFWAFFPTHTQTYLPGILNAPWKLNSDRNAIIGGEWNGALMAAAAEMIAESLPGLSSPDDPARPLDTFPRQMDRKDEDAAPLVETLWKRIETTAVIPDATGTLRVVSELLRHPRDTLLLAKTWQTLAKEEQRRQLVHPTCLARQRPSRLNALAERIQTPSTVEAPPSLRRCNSEFWFGCVANTDPTASLGVLGLASSFARDSKAGEWDQIRPKLAIVPTEGGALVVPGKAVLAPEGISVPGRETVAAALQADSEARDVLRNVLQVREPDDQLWESVLRDALPSLNLRDEDREKRWQAFWSCVRLVPSSVRQRFLVAHRDRVRVRRRDGRWAKVDGVLLLGGLVQEDDSSSNSRTLVDLDTHRNDRLSLDFLSVVDCPTGDIGPASWNDLSRNDTSLLPWLGACRDRYKQEHKNSATPSYLEPDSLSMPRGFALLTELTSGPNAQFTSHLLGRLEEPKYLDTIHFGHSTMSVYPKIDVPHPLPWFLLSHGKVWMGTAASAPLRALVARRHESALKTPPVMGSVEKTLDKLASAFPHVAPSEKDLGELWAAAFDALVSADAVSSDALIDLWLASGKDCVVPAHLPSPTGPVALHEVFVTTSADLACRARINGRVVVSLDAPTMQLWLDKGAQALADLMQVEWESLTSPPQRLTDVVPEIAEALRSDARESARCQCANRLHLRICETIQPTPCLMWDGTLYLDPDQLAPLSRNMRLRCLLAEIAPTGWLDGSADQVLQRLGDSHVDQRRDYVAQGETLPDRLLRAVGGRSDPLLAALGRPLNDQPFVRQCLPQQLAELALAQLGPSTLSALQVTLDEEGLQPPTRWNTTAAQTFVTSIGFPAEFAASAQARREAEEFASGPINLPPLHDFQQEVLDGLTVLLASGNGRRRAVVSLPTGGGKTRVTVETAVRLVLAPEGARRSVIWVAQTDELCEQAVQAFRQVWVNLGAQRTDLRIVRLWGGNPNPAGQELDKPIVIVSSIQTLNYRIGAEGLAWLRKPSLVVVDECHHAITPSYTALLSWLDAEAPRPGTPEKDEPLIVGLSATPFRMDDEESRRLARRFDQRWLPQDQEQLYARLRQQRVLARPCYESLDSGSGLTDDELGRLDHIGSSLEGLDFENLLEAINQRLAGDPRRNERLVQCIQASEERSILFFTNSVAHGEEMAARLNLAGIAAAAISGDTPTATRRWFLDRFHRGLIRVLCNHSVLTTGFDAPRIDMVLIARQVFSPVRYMQMVGRGLRGEKNGGTESCRIVTVIDNLGRFQNRHPYHYCQRYFTAIESV